MKHQMLERGVRVKTKMSRHFCSCSALRAHFSKLPETNSLSQTQQLRLTDAAPQMIFDGPYPNSQWLVEGSAPPPKHSSRQTEHDALPHTPSNARAKRGGDCRAWAAALLVHPASKCCGEPCPALTKRSVTALLLHTLCDDVPPPDEDCLARSETKTPLSAMQCSICPETVASHPNLTHTTDRARPH